MWNSYSILYFLMILVIFSEGMPMSTNSSSDELAQSNEENTFFNRDLQDKIDGSIHQIKSIGVTYHQRIQDNQCFVEYDGRLLAESTVLKIRKKVFRVDNCLLERVYHACGPNLILMLSVACGVLEKHKDLNTPMNFKREASLYSGYYIDTSVHHAKRVITESCCENLCNIEELTRYCH